MHSLSLADELADIRREIALLKTREAELRKAILAHPGQVPDGRWARVTVCVVSQRVFDRALLPPHIRDDPRYCREQMRTYVRSLPLEKAQTRQKWPDRKLGGSAHLGLRT